MSDPEYDIMLGNPDQNKPSPQYGIFAEVHPDEKKVGPGRRIALDLNEPVAMTITAAMRYGKSYLASVLTEMYGIQVPNLNRLTNPACHIVFHWSEELTFACEFMSQRQPQTVPEQLAALTGHWGSSAVAFPDVVLLCPETMMAERRAEYPGVQVVALKAGVLEVGFTDWQMLMGLADSGSLEAKTIGLALGEMSELITIGRIRHAIESDGDIQDVIKRHSRLRLRVMEQFVHNDAKWKLASLVKPGRLIVVDFRDPRLSKGEVYALMQVMMAILASAKDEKGKYIPKVMNIDEVHQYTEGESQANAQAFVQRMVRSVRLVRKRGASLIFSSQDPDTVPLKILELSPFLAAGRYTAESWYPHLCRGCRAFNQIDPIQLFDCERGSFYIWSLNSSDREFTRRPVKVRVRPSATAPGGTSQTATGDAA